MKRVASVIGLPEANREAYEAYHSAVWLEVLDRLAASHVHNYSIYRFGELLFSYFEYTGDDYGADMAAIAADEATRRWWAVQEPLQRPLDTRADGEWWQEIPEVFHTD